MTKRYRFDGSIYNFIGIMSWALTVKKAAEENHPAGFEVSTNSDVNERVAKEFGITTDALLYELVRLGKEAQDTLEYNLYKMNVAAILENRPEEKTFMQLLLEDEVHFDDVDDFIEFWHTDYKGDKKLYEFLGLSEKQYEEFAKSGTQVLANIYNERIK